MMKFNEQKTKWTNIIIEKWQIIHPSPVSIGKTRWQNSIDTEVHVVVF